MRERKGSLGGNEKSRQREREIKREKGTLLLLVAVEPQNGFCHKKLLPLQKKRICQSRKLLFAERKGRPTLPL